MAPLVAPVHDAVPSLPRGADVRSAHGRAPRAPGAGARVADAVAPPERRARATTREHAAAAVERVDRDLQPRDRRHLDRHVERRARDRPANCRSSGASGPRGLSLSAYLASKVVVLGAITILQIIVYVLIATAAQHGPNDAVALGSGRLELAVDVAVAAFAGMCLGLLISAAARTSEQAMTVLPVVLIAQMVLASGAVFPDASERLGLRQAREVVSAQWGFSAAAATDRPQPDPGVQQPRARAARGRPRPAGPDRRRDHATHQGTHPVGTPARPVAHRHRGDARPQPRRADRRRPRAGPSRSGAGAVTRHRAGVLVLVLVLRW